jgi:putative endonuclease
MVTWYVYVLKCVRGDRYWLYTGYTNDLKGRVQKHEEGKGAKFTRSFNGNVQLVYHELFSTKSEAMIREYEIKQMKREEKDSLVGL